MDKKIRELTQIRTDLALEAAEYYGDGSTDIEGVIVRETYDTKNDILVTRVKITNEAGAARLRKAIGTYITIETPHLNEADESYHKEITEALMKEFLALVPDIKEKKVLVAGIGNREITPDALGPLVVEHLFITRHLIRSYGENTEITKGLGNISAIAPGVMAQTGMEGVEIIKGIIEATQPEILIVIDALAARSTKRLNRTIQVTDTGIHPGAGVGNYRNELTKKTLGIPVVAVGIPTVIDAATIVSDTMTSLFEVLENQKKLGGLYEASKDFDAEEKYYLVREMMEPSMSDMFVTPKDIDETIGRISFTVSEAINSICHTL